MSSSHSAGAAREISVPTRTQSSSEPTTPPSHPKMWRFWSGVVFGIALLSVFAQPLLALMNYAARSQLFSYILLIPFVSAYLLYIRRDQLPKNYLSDLPIAGVCMAGGLGVLAFTYWIHFAGWVWADNDRLALGTLSFLCCLAAGGFSFSDELGCEQLLSLWVT